MKELENIKSDKVKIVDQRQVEQEKQFLVTVVRHNGHTMWEINCTTGEIKPAEYKEEKIVLVERRDLNYNTVVGTDSLRVKDVVCKENCLYIPALNIKSVKKKYLKWLIEQKGEKIQSLKSNQNPHPQE
jgi:hypothetical protein